MDSIFTAPTVPGSAADIFPEGTESFGAGLWEVLQEALAYLSPGFYQASAVCLSVLAVVVLISLLGNDHTIPAVTFAGTVILSLLLLSPANTLMELGSRTIQETTEYSKLLIPVMSAALAAQGAVGTSAALYAGTAVLNTVLSGILSGVLVSAIYAYLALSSAAAATGVGELNSCADLIKSLCTWGMKAVLYIFTGYMSITGVVSGGVDAAALKAAKITISGAVPVVGGILSDASESVLAGIGVLKNAAGVYGILAILAIGIRPFLRIGAQYLLLKLTAAVSGIFAEKPISGLIEAYCSAFGMILAMTGTISLLFLISTVCFLKGVS